MPDRAQIREALSRGWHLSRAEARIRRHDWDVADVMRVYDDVMAAEDDQPPESVVSERS